MEKKKGRCLTNAWKERSMNGGIPPEQNTAALNGSFFYMKFLRLLRHFVLNCLKMWALQFYQVSQLSHAIFV